MSTYFVNPDNFKPIKIGKENFYAKFIADRVPSMYSKLVCIWIILFIIAISLISRPSNIEGKKKTDTYENNFIKNENYEVNQLENSIENDELEITTV